jgi:phage terminase small subunit|tara:strand:- start:558 stop:1076 length:519 start_codon:yes stop_codon:yes gene_type:complete
MKQLSYTSLIPTEEGNAFVDDKGKIWQPLNSKQKLFCKEYLKGQTATESAIKAGYTKDRKGAKTQGSVLLNHNPVVRNYLIDLEIAASQKDAVSLEDHLSTLHDLREEAKDQGQISAAITAEVHRGKAGGLYIDRREILTAKIDMMSKDDLLTRLEDLIKKRVVEGRIVEQG